VLTNPEKSVTVESITKELTDLESSYKIRRKTLRALLSALQAEVVKPQDQKSGTGDAN